MKTIHILGQANVAVGIMLDIIYLKYGKEYTINIYNNIPSSENEISDVPFMHPELDVAVIQSNTIKKIESKKSDMILLAGASSKTKVLIFNDFQSRHNIHANEISSLIHPSAIIAHGTTVGHGVLIGPGVIIAPYTTIGDFVTINRNVSIGHHDTIDAFSSINPGCNIGGFAEIGKHVTIGLGTSIFDHVSIGNGSVIGGGSTVNKNIPENTLAFGTPAKVMKKLG